MGLTSLANESDVTKLHCSLHFSYIVTVLFSLYILPPYTSVYKSLSRETLILLKGHEWPFFLSQLIPSHRRGIRRCREEFPRATAPRRYCPLLLSRPRSATGSTGTGRRSRGQTWTRARTGGTRPPHPPGSGRVPISHRQGITAPRRNRPLSLSRPRSVTGSTGTASRSHGQSWTRARTGGTRPPHPPGSVRVPIPPRQGINAKGNACRDGCPRPPPNQRRRVHRILSDRSLSRCHLVEGRAPMPPRRGIVAQQGRYGRPRPPPR